MTKPIVLYKNRPAIIISELNGKFEIETENGIKKVREKDFIILEKNNTKSLNIILNEKCSPPNLSELRDFFEDGKATFPELIELAWENLTPEKTWKAWELLSSSPLLITEAPNKQILIRTEEEVNAKLKKQSEKDAAEKERNEFINDLKLYIKQDKKNIFDYKKYAQFLQEVEAFALGKMDKSKVLKDIHIKETLESAHKFLIQTGFWKIEKNPYPTRAGYPLNSSKIKIPEPNRNHEYIDLTHLTAYAIDSEDSTDPDDAICFDGEYLWIHVANPADTIIPDSKSDLDARKRGSTLYLPDGVSRMLGEEAVNYFALGLNPESYALSFKLKLDEKAEIIDCDILRTKIKVNCISYNNADTKKENEHFKPLFKIAELNQIKRENAGAVEIKMPEVKISVKTENEKQTVLIENFGKTESFLMIKEMMLLAGEAAAKFAFKNNIPFQFISQDAPEIPKKLPMGLAGEYRKRKSMRPRSVGTIPSRHAGLGISMYSQVTSPLRRYGDLIAHQQLLKFIDGKDLMPTDELLMKIGAGDIAARNCSNADRNSKQHWKLIYLLQNKNWTGEAIILETLKKTARVCIPSLAYETEIRLHKELSINEKIILKIEEIDIPRLNVKFSIKT